jgi:hypothetical protein
MPTFNVTFTKVSERTYAVPANEEDTAINAAWDKLRDGEETETDSESDWSVKEAKRCNTVSLTDEDHDLITVGLPRPALVYVLNKMCGENYSFSNGRHTDLAWEVCEYVRNGTVSMLAVRAIATQMQLHRESALAKLTEDERLALGVEY